MSAIEDKNCGCKGIRTCLLCEKTNGSPLECERNEQVKYVYTYCPHCNLCWPDNYDVDCKVNLPLYLGKLNLILDFLSAEEEAVAISAIDRIQWMPSQSGRKKQDFGPKVNFKKKKVKIGDFKGFPKFTESILQKFENLSHLSDFKPVELCHLEYTPERGSSIDPHIDDFWLWGERLVTINLNSSTVLTLLTHSKEACMCHEESSHLAQDPLCVMECDDKLISCDDKFQNISDLKYSLQTSPSTCIADSGEDDIKVNISKEVEDFHISELSTVSNVSNSNHVIDGINNRVYESNLDSKVIDLHMNDDLQTTVSCCHVKKRKIPNATSLASQTPTNFRLSKCGKYFEGKTDMCSVFRTGMNASAVAVKVHLPPRSLLVLAGCARYNWTHEIRRKDVVSRRLAMTFRELTEEFLDGGKESELGKELLLTASNFCDFN